MNEASNQPRGAARFATTHWSVVLRAGAAKPSESQQALGELIQAYWYPLYAFSRRKGQSDHDAMDLTQGFFAHLLAGAALGSVSPEKGRFRSFLLAAFENYMANQRRAAAAFRRGGSAATLSLTTPDFQTRYDNEPAHEVTPELLYQRSWVDSLLTRARDRLVEDYQRAGKSELFALLEPHLELRNDAPAQADIGRALNLSLAAVKMSLHRMRRRCGELLRQEVAATLHDPAEVEDELRGLLEIVGRPA